MWVTMDVDLIEMRGAVKCNHCMKHGVQHVYWEKEIWQPLQIFIVLYNNKCVLHPDRWRSETFEVGDWLRAVIQEVCSV